MGYDADGYIANITEAIEFLNEKTCLHFLLLEPDDLYNESSYLDIQPISGCWSYVGFYGGRQEISLSKHCGRIGTIQHEILHSIGFWHEHSRRDRDDYLDIKWQNIINCEEEEEVLE